MTADLLASTDKHKAFIVAASAVTMVEPREDYVIPDSDYELVTDARVATWVRFQNLRREWGETRGAWSSVAEMVTLSAYQKIIGMGWDVLPCILIQLRSEGDQPDHWFWALEAIAGDDLVPPQNRGKVQEMAKAWLEWGEKAGQL